MLLDQAVWRLVKARLSSFTRNNKFIERCYLRHSTAFGPQDPFLSDFDVAFFIKSKDLSEFLIRRKVVLAALSKDFLFKRIAMDFGILPASENAYELTRKHHFFRSVYPFETWRRPDEPPCREEVRIRPTLPLDHVPEVSLYHNVLPLINLEKKKRRLERQYLARQVVKSASRVGCELPAREIKNEFSALLSEMDIWGTFYGSLKWSEQPQEASLTPRPDGELQAFSLRWESAASCLKDPSVIASIWVYPQWMGAPYLSVNFCPSVTETDCQQALAALRELFSRLRCRFLVGREESMVGRINGLAAQHLFEPVLFQRHAVCLQGDINLRSRIVIPSSEVMNEKFKCRMFISFYKWIDQDYSYKIYFLPFVMEHFNNTGELILDSESLSKVFGDEMALSRGFNPRKHVSALCARLKEKHAFSFFE